MPWNRLEQALGHPVTGLVDPSVRAEAKTLVERLMALVDQTKQRRESEDRDKALKALLQTCETLSTLLVEGVGSEAQQSTDTYDTKWMMAGLGHRSGPLWKNCIQALDPQLKDLERAVIASAERGDGAVAVIRTGNQLMSQLRTALEFAESDPQRLQEKLRAHKQQTQARNRPQSTTQPRPRPGAAPAPSGNGKWLIIAGVVAVAVAAWFVLGTGA